MNANRWLIGLSVGNVVACLVLAGIAWSLGVEARGVRLETEARRTQARMELQQRSAELRGWIAERESSEQVAVSALGPPAAAAPTAAAPVETFRQQQHTFVDRLRTLPEYTPYLMRNTRRSVIERSGAAIDELNLPSDQREKLIQLLVDSELAMADARAVLQAQGSDANGPVAQQMRQKIVAERNEQLRSRFGETTYRAYHDRLGFHEQRRTYLDACNTALAVAGAPALDSDQLYAAYRAHHQARVQVPQPKSRDEWAAALRPQVTAPLTAAQLDVLIDHTYAFQRRYSLTQEIRQKLARDE
jgi:hypothetical protein